MLSIEKNAMTTSAKDPRSRPTFLSTVQHRDGVFKAMSKPPTENRARYPFPSVFRMQEVASVRSRPMPDAARRNPLSRVSAMRLFF